MKTVGYMYTVYSSKHYPQLLSYSWHSCRKSWLGDDDGVADRVKRARRAAVVYTVGRHGPGVVTGALHLLTLW